MDTDENIEHAEAPEAAPQGAPVKTIEQWAADKKLLPAFFPPPNFRAPKGAAGPGGVLRIRMTGMTGPVPNRDHWKFAAARIGEQWPEGKELTESQFDEAIAKHTTHVCR